MNYFRIYQKLLQNLAFSVVTSAGLERIVIGAALFDGRLAS